MRLVYFARVREAVGIDAEDRELPDGVRSVADCIAWLSSQSEHHATAFGDRSRLRFALDQQMVREDALLDGASELAIFPPVTGG
jgi:sulfur-carrier protein